MEVALDVALAGSAMAAVPVNHSSWCNVERVKGKRTGPYASLVRRDVRRPVKAGA
ncbi:hypothetical protein LQT97_13465 [Brucella pseudogrignonensis]|uniref:hypothetical protein n=1 Tax=Brucella pseudogrignonensis TaxID=419475 RepID=UPI00190D4C61|nr:hypothetical protein [Brucella pseudogrignonensis]MBK0022839.1 hypothetical protein [Ochrobactrum sp. S45]MBK0044854.1 hypothetical protein [Ochrobactrum sp. S46]MCD4512234.1 hypothetical protein [Brucella pseudogrignonensis]UKK95765.1 hypothetical protein L7D45_20625 [Brucella pseudogrignonensis]